MKTNDLCNFLRFTTGSSVCIASKISVTFNSSSGLARRPIAHTCSNTLELSGYVNYHDFSAEWHAILGDTMSGSGIWMDFNLDTIPLLNYNTSVTITSLLFQVIIIIIILF